MTAVDQSRKLVERFGGVLSEPAEFRGEVTLVLGEAVRIAEVCEFAKASLGFDYLVDITSVDNYGEDPRFTLVYELYGIEHGCHLRLKLSLGEEEEVPTVTRVWRTADWHEREVFDMMGIRFKGHADLRRILMWDGYPYFPLRKDFPLEGKATSVPDVAFTRSSPMEGGPFVTASGGKTAADREPRSRQEGK